MHTHFWVPKSDFVFGDFRWLPESYFGFANNIIQEELQMAAPLDVQNRYLYWKDRTCMF